MTEFLRKLLRNQNLSQKNSCIPSQKTYQINFFSKAIFTLRQGFFDDKTFILLTEFALPWMDH